MQLVTEENITDLAAERWATARDPRLAELMTALVRHLHAFAREVRLTEAEWMAAIQWLNRTGQISDEKREEFILTSDVLGLSMLVGTFIIQMRARSGYNFTVLLIGAAIQLVSGVALYGLAMAGDGEVNHMKLGIKALVAIVVFVAALVGFLRQRAIRTEKSRLTAGGAVSVGNLEVERKLGPFFHTAGGLAVVNMLIAVFWR